VELWRVFGGGAREEDGEGCVTGEFEGAVGEG
jgi:hypothetical protein